jgi:hypothetical protein
VHRPQEDFRRAVVERDHLVGEIAGRSAATFHLFQQVGFQAPGESKIGQFHSKVIVQQDVTRLDVSVHHLVFVHMGQRRQELLKDALDLDRRELVGHVNQPRQIVRHVFEHEK